MIVYNICRFYLTRKVSFLRDAEERARVTPSRMEYMGKTDQPFDSCSFWVAIREVGKLWLSDFIHWCQTVFVFANRKQRTILPPSPIQYLGLYRIHQIANVFMFLSFFILFLQMLRWLWWTQIPT